MQKITTANLNEEGIELLKACHPRVTDDTIQQLTKTGRIPESFEPKSLVRWKKFVRLFSKNIINQDNLDCLDGFVSEWKFEIVCPWSADDARRIVGDKDYASIVSAIKSLDEKYISKLHTLPSIYSELMAKGFETTQRLYAAVRVEACI